MASANSIVPAYQNTLLVHEAREEIKRRARVELERRAKQPGYLDFVAKDIVSGLHPAQTVAYSDCARYKAFCCSRRAGKTALVIRMIVLALAKAGFNQWVFFIAPTLFIGRDLIWDELEALVEKYHLPWKMNRQECYIETPTKGKFRIVGLDKAPQVDKLRGYDTVLFITDETQNYEHLLPPLIQAVSPALTGRRGSWVSVGTPGPTMEGFWYDISHGKRGFVSHHWTLVDNTKNPRPGDEVIAEELALHGWTREHPTARRELFGEWCEDHNYLVCEYSHVRNGIGDMPNDYSLAWQHVIGIDVGYTDATAWVVLAVDPHSRRTVVVHGEQIEQSTLDTDCEITKRLMAQYKTSRVVCDPAGGGKKFYETFNARYGANLRGANKVDKLGTIKLLNTELRTGRLQCVENATVDLVVQLRTLRWKDEFRQDILESKEYPDHSFDALRYALIEAAPWAVQDRATELTEEQALREERARRQRQKQAKKWFERGR